MGWKYRLTPPSMVLYVLSIEAGEFMSIKDIQHKILKTFEYTISRQCITKAIETADYTTGIIVEGQERRGPLNLPVKVFSIITNESKS